MISSYRTTTHSLALALAGALALAALLAPSAQAAFGLKDLDVTFTAKDGSPVTQAGAHPYEMTTSLSINTVEAGGVEVPEGEVKDLTVEQIPGFAGKPGAVPTCSAADFNTRVEGRAQCPSSTALGISAVKAEFDSLPPETDLYLNVPVYNLAPPPGAVARLGFVALNVPVTIDAGLTEQAPYNVVAKLRNIPQAILFYSSRLTLWGNPADPDHDELRGDCVGEPLDLTAAPVSLGSCGADIPEEPFLTMPRACRGPLATLFEARSWQDPGTLFAASALTHDGSTPPGPQGMTGCEKLAFSPRIAATPTTAAAESPAGLEFSLDVTDEGLGSPTGLAHSDIKAVEVALPAGITANPSAAAGLGVCSPADYGRETLSSAPGEGCPESAKLGTVEVRTPLLDRTLRGSLFLAEPRENPFGSLLAIYLVIRDTELGVIVKQAGEVDPDAASGRLITRFDEIPQIPLSHVGVRFREGARAPLVSPPACGTYTTTAELTPWADPGSPILARSSFQISTGVHGGPCPPGGTPPFEPGFEAGAVNNQAGAYSPFAMRFTRRDGDQDLTRLSAALPPGTIARLAGTAQCPDAALAAAKARDGRAELASPSCPASAQIGSVYAGAGVGEALTYVPGKVYLAGPYNGAPLSAVGIVPAVAGPFDVGVVVTRFALRIDPRTAEVTVDGEASDPIPHILEGIPLKVRDVRVHVDRPQFTLNPTSCDPAAVGALLWGGGADVFNPADDSPVSRSSYFQAAGCASLGFKPRLALRLKGGTRRGAFPALRGVYRPRAGDANLSKLVLRLPRSAFLEQGHIGTICTRVQFAAKACPPRSVYGRARAFTPLLDQPLEGPVYLRSSNNNLPDFVASLHGIVDVEAFARIDSVKGGIRATFSGVPDAPLSRVVVAMRGGKKGLIVNSRNLCRGKNRANALFAAHSGKRNRIKPVVRAAGCAKSKKRRHRRHVRG